MLALDVDPKLAWALAHRERFPIDLNRAPKELLLRVPGLGTRAVARIVAARRVRKLRFADLERLHIPLVKAIAFVEVADHRPGKSLAASDLARRLAAAVHPTPSQASLFDFAAGEPQGALSSSP
jgi:predicted DNA-binding helix-hairpin-helix protein